MAKKQKTAWESFCDAMSIIILLIGIGVIVGLYWASKSHDDKYSYIESSPTTSYVDQNYEKV